MNYEELVKALRCCAENFGCPIECPRYSPADEGVRACVSRLEKDAAAAIEELQAHLPKRGEWIYHPKDAIEMMFTLPKCSICGHESSDALNYCPNCGAKMNDSNASNALNALDNAQDGPIITPCRGCSDYDGYGGCKSKGGCARKLMEVQDG